VQLKLSVTRRGTPIFAATYQVSDAGSFGAACSDIWEKLNERKIAKASSIGALYDSLEDSKAADLRGLRIELEPVGDP
jgi:hypothetical protein